MKLISEEKVNVFYQNTIFQCEMECIEKSIEFAEIELQNLTIDFAEFILNNCEIIERDYFINCQIKTSNEVFNMFLSERNKI